MSEKLRLYSYFRSSCAWRVRLALEWKNIDYEVVTVNLLKGEQNSDDYKRVNPLAQVPALLIAGNQLLTQSLSIIEYLEEVYPRQPLLPKDVVSRARVRQIAELIASGIQPLQNLSTINKVSSEQEKKLEFGGYWIAKGFNALEILLQQTSGKYCVGDEITTADICLVPQVANADRFNVSLEKYPIIKRINSTLINLEEFKRAHPFMQPDCPDELKK